MDALSFVLYDYADNVMKEMHMRDGDRHRLFRSGGYEVWYRPPNPDSIGNSHKGGDSNKLWKLTSISVLTTRALMGKGPFEALAHRGRGAAIDG